MMDSGFIYELNFRFAMESTSDLTSRLNLTVRGNFKFGIERRLSRRFGIQLNLGLNCEFNCELTAEIKPEITGGIIPLVIGGSKHVACELAQPSEASCLSYRIRAG